MSFPGRPRIDPPPDCDLTRSSQQLAEAHGVSRQTARRWRKEAGVVMRIGPGPGMRPVNLRLWGMLTQADWQKGSIHAGRLMGVSSQAAQEMRQKLIDAGKNVPTLKRGQKGGTAQP